MYKIYIFIDIFLYIFLLLFCVSLTAGDIDYTRKLMSSGAAACAYVPSLPKPPGEKIEKTEMTEMRSVFRARCLAQLLKIIKAASKTGTIEFMPVSSTFHLLLCTATACGSSKQTTFRLLFT